MADGESMSPKRFSLRHSPFAILLACCAGASWAQQAPYPAKPVRLVVGFAAGGATDISARHIAQKLTETVGQSFVVENRPGAASTLASEFVARKIGRASCR